MESKPDLDSLRKHIKAEDFIGAFRHPEQYQFVMVAGPMVGQEPDINNAVGYCVQVRKGRGQFGSDQVFIRHCDGSMVVHENQGWFALSDEVADRIKPFFELLPGDEDPTKAITYCGEEPEIGFVIQ